MKKETFTRAEVLQLLEDLAFHFSDNGDPDTDVESWFNDMMDDDYDDENET